MMLFNKTKKVVPTVYNFVIDRHRENYDFEMISHTVTHKHIRPIKDFLTVDYAISEGHKKCDLYIDIDHVPDEIDMAYRYEYNDEDIINMTVAKYLDMNVLRLMQGDSDGMEFMFRQYEGDIGISLFCYGVLALDYADPKVARTIRKNKYTSMEIKDIIGDSLFRKFVEK